MKKSKIIIILALIVLVVLGFIINYNYKHSEKYAHTTALQKGIGNQLIENNEILSSISTNDLNKIIENKLPEWKSYWQKIIPGFDISNFKKIRESTIATEEYPYDSKENRSDLREKKSYYIYSPNKSKILDPYGQVFLGEENGKIVEYLDVDSSVKLIDLKTNKWKQIASCGTPCGFSGATWIDDNTFVVVGRSEYYPENGEIRCTVDTKCTDVATLIIFDLSKNTSTSYYGPEVDQKITRSESEASVNEEVSLTYTYKNHGFTIELPKGYIPHEEQAEGGPAIMIKLPVGGLAYVTDASFWEKYNIPSTYLKDEKIGDITFKIYTSPSPAGKIYWFKKGNVGYEFSMFKFGTTTDTTELENLIKTFKFVGWTQ